MAKRLMREKVAQGKKADKQQIMEEIARMRQKKCDWSFKSVERDVRIQFNP